MKHFPIFLALEGRRIVLTGGGETALAKLRLLLKTEARIEVYAENPAAEIMGWAQENRLHLIRRPLAKGDVQGAALFYAAEDDAEKDAATAAIAAAEGALVNIVDNLEDSQFITPAIVDRDPVTIAIGTEGAAPVLARAIKSDLEARLPANLGLLARIGKAFRSAAEVLPMGRRRRDFWADYYFNAGPRAMDQGGETAVEAALPPLLEQYQHRAERDGHVAFVGAGPGDPELLTLKARKALDAADVVIHDRLAGSEILELARREAVLVEAGKAGFGPSTPQEEINRLIIAHASTGAQVVRLKDGDPGIFGRLDEEIEAVEAAGITWHVIPGIATARQRRIRRGRNGAMRLPQDLAAAGFTGLALYGRAPRAAAQTLPDIKQELA